MAVRHEVFVIGQNVPAELEKDGADPYHRHLLVREDGRPVGTARMLHSGHIGRVAVIASHRGRGIGRAIMQALFELGQGLGLSQVDLAAQTHAVHFYERLGFVAEGEVFYEAGIPHRRMVKKLACPDSDPEQKLDRAQPEPPARRLPPHHG